MTAHAVPVTILTGFLGSGKTTLLNRLLREPDLAGAAVIVNEFGEVGVDHLLVESSGETLVELSNGCVCCTVRGELVDTLSDLVDRVQTGRLAPLSRVVVETTGLADPTPVIASLAAHPVLLQHFALDGVVSVVDALHGARTLDDHEEARRQVACADRIVLSKLDLAPDATDRLRSAVAGLNPRAAVLDARSADPAALLGCGLVDPTSGRIDVTRWIGGGETARPCAPGCADPAHDHDHGHHAAPHRHGAIGSLSLVHDEPIASTDLDAFLDLLRWRLGERILRLKAIVRLREDEHRPLAVHGVRGYLHPSARLPAWPAGEPHRTRFVVIGEGLDEDLVRSLFAAFTGAPRIDAPDRAALLDNPLALASRGF